MADPPPGELRRLVLEQHPVRGFWVQLGETWAELKSQRDYPPAVEALLGEAVAAAVLLAATLKFQGSLTLQLNGDGAVPLLVAQCTHDFKVRAVAQVSPGVEVAGDFPALTGAGRLTVTVETDERGARYQGIVMLQGATLAACLENYFATSEQLPTLLQLSADRARAGGLLLQRLPGEDAHSAGLATQQVWATLQRGLGELPSALLRDAAVTEVVARVCGEYDCRLFATTTVQFACRCSEPRVASLLRSLGPEEMHAVLAEQGAVSVTCDFCGRLYKFDAVDVERLFVAGASPDAPQSIN